VINAAGFVRVADAEHEAEACRRGNTDGPALLAAACAARGLPLLTFSSDLVFDGTLGRAYAEDDKVAPTGQYGRSKADGERLVSAAAPSALIVRTAAFFGAWDAHNFAHHVLAALARGETVRASASDSVSPTFVPDLCHAAFDLLIDGARGLWHLANQGAVSWHDFACRLAAGAGFDPARVIAEFGPVRSTALTSARGILLRPLDQAIAAYLHDRLTR
jgi:dTDP-4-dehydrorhamnose reductase